MMHLIDDMVHAELPVLLCEKAIITLHIVKTLLNRATEII